eukprot:323760-Pelagomonas_calceolata.AAC.3
MPTEYASYGVNCPPTWTPALTVQPGMKPLTPPKKGLCQIISTSLTAPLSLGGWKFTWHLIAKRISDMDTMTGGGNFHKTGRESVRLSASVLAFLGNASNMPKTTGEPTHNIRSKHHEVWDHKEAQVDQAVTDFTLMPSNLSTTAQPQKHHTCVSACVCACERTCTHTHAMLLSAPDNILWLARGSQHNSTAEFDDKN